VRSYERYEAGLVHRGGHGLTHVLLIIDGGYFMDSEYEVACTRERRVMEIDVIEGIATCVACWARVFSCD
jgi:hypothetical protein